MAERVLIRAGTSTQPPLVMRPHEIAVTADNQIWLGDADGTPVKPANVGFDPVAYAAWFDALPTTPPADAKAFWNDGGVLARTP